MDFLSEFEFRCLRVWSVCTALVMESRSWKLNNVLQERRAVQLYEMRLKTDRLPHRLQWSQLGKISNFFDRTNYIWMIQLFFTTEYQRNNITSCSFAKCVIMIKSDRKMLHFKNNFFWYDWIGLDRLYAPHLFIFKISCLFPTFCSVLRVVLEERSWSQRGFILWGVGLWKVGFMFDLYAIYCQNVSFWFFLGANGSQWLLMLMSV